MFSGVDCVSKLGFLAVLNLIIGKPYRLRGVVGPKAPGSHKRNRRRDNTADA
jgi:hypothetical protein